MTLVIIMMVVNQLVFLLVRNFLMVVVGGPSYGSASGSVWLDQLPREAYIDTNIDWYIDNNRRDYYLQNPRRI